MIVHEQERVDSAHSAERSAEIYLHPKTAKASAAMADSLAHEFRRWMADEIEEISELVTVSAIEGPSYGSTAQIIELADQLADQAEMLGYPHIVEIARRLKQYAEQEGPETADIGNLDEQLEVLRHAIGR